MSYLKIIFFLFFTILFSGCCRRYVSIQEEWVDKEYLASSYVNTPDPEQNCPPCGKNILIEWNFPISLFRQGLCIILTTRLWDNTTCVYRQKIQNKQGCSTMYFSYKDLNKRLLTYKIEVVNNQNKIIEIVENQFWTEKLDVP